MIIHDCDQNSPEWLSARLGLATASCFKDILAKGEGKTRRSYLRRLAGEQITGKPLESYTNAAMQRGHEMEQEARDYYAFHTDCEPQQVGFITNEIAGCSPDSLIGEEGLLEIKTQRPDLLIETIEADIFPKAHIPQVQGQLWVTHRKWCDLLVYFTNMPPFIKRAYRDEAYIENLAKEVALFNEELAALVEKIKNYRSA